MCIVYFASHTTCAHHHLLGAYNCTLNCPTSTRHTFYLRGHEYDCQTCTFLQGNQIDPNIVPVTYYPPLFDADKLAAGDAEREKEDAVVAEQESENEEKHDVEGNDYKALSDPDSETSEWRQDDESEFQFESGKGQEWAAPGNRMHPPPPTPSTPRTKAHRHLVREQLEKLKPRGMNEGTRMSIPRMAVFTGEGYWGNGLAAPLAHKGFARGGRVKERSNKRGRGA